MGEVVHPAEVHAHLVAVIDQVAHQVEVVLDGGEDDGLTEALLGRAAEQAALGRLAVARFLLRHGVGHGRGRALTPTATGAEPEGASAIWISAPAPVISRRRRMSPVSMLRRRCVMAWMSVSGVGGHPGA